MRRLVEHGVPVVLVAAHAAPQGHMTHALAVLGSFPCRAADAWHPRDFLRLTASKRMPERGSVRACRQRVEQASEDHTLSCRFQSRPVPASHGPGGWLNGSSAGCWAGMRASFSTSARTSNGRCPRFAQAGGSLWLRRPHRRQPGRPDHPGVPPSLALRPGPHGRVLRRCRFLPRLRRALLLPPLATVRQRLRLLPRGHGKSLDPHW